MIPARALLAAAAVCSVAGLAACEKKVQAPTDTGVCYAISLPENEEGEPTFNVVARDQPQIEYCAARLEEMRVRFLRMGGSNNEVVGSYQGQFIFISREGVYFARSLEGVRFFALARTGDGRLAIPGTIEQRVEPATPPAAPAAPPAG